MTVQLESSDFSCDHVQVRELTGRERIGQLFSFDVLMVVADAEGPSARALAGASVSLVFVDDGVEIRKIHGMIAQATDRGDTETEFRSYRIRIVPRAHRLALVRTQDVYVSASIPDVIKKKFALAGLEDALDLRLHEGSYPARDFVVQYEETDLDFVARLAEHLGLSFFFEHEGDADKVVFTDSNNGFTLHEAKVPFRRRGDHRDVYALEVTSSILPSLYAVCDYNYEKPLVDLSATHELPDAYGGGIIEYGLNYKDPAEGKRFAQVRAEEHHATGLVFAGESAVCALSAGVRFSVEGHPRFVPCDLLVTEVEHRAKQVALGSAGNSDDVGYMNTFRAIPVEVPHRPRRLTPKPRIVGVVSGIVEQLPGGSSQQPWIDDQGRYIVRVLFDTAEPGEQRASLPIRMAQAHAGPSYGIHFPLRPGVEVLLAFIGGDPDRPVIVGAVPNAVTPSPIVSRDSLNHRIKTSSGSLFEIHDAK